MKERSLSQVAFSPTILGLGPSMPADSTLFIILLIVGIFAVDIGRRWWRETEWKRRWRRDRDDEQ